MTTDAQQTAEPQNTNQEPAGEQPSAPRVLPEHQKYETPTEQAPEPERTGGAQPFLNAVIHESDEPERATPRRASEPALKAATARADARKQAQEMLADKKGPLMNSDHRNHALALKKYHELLAKL